MTIPPFQIGQRVDDCLRYHMASVHISGGVAWDVSEISEGLSNTGIIMGQMTERANQADRENAQAERREGKP